MDMITAYYCSKAEFEEEGKTLPFFRTTGFILKKFFLCIALFSILRALYAGINVCKIQNLGCES